ncbi:MAG: 4-hydroxy-3-methylbut-2-enyl diphosphate reductase [Nitrospinae bacterium]|nr:4-hydroxy-3-methylbut-2-enyl diphosphate reductase [Nitrospinota bacterium]
MFTKKKLNVLLANPRGFCAGVVRAIDIVNRSLEKYGPPIYVRHEIVHNKYVVESLRKKGARFVNELDEVPEGAITIFSAHGVAKKVFGQAELLGLDVVDATCPLVEKVHEEGRKYYENGMEVVLIGHKNHPEVVGTMGQVPGEVRLISSIEDALNFKPKDTNKISYITQTTLSIDDTSEIVKILKTRFPDIKGPNLKDICYATQNRQTAIREIAKKVDLILVVGSNNSSNSNRLCEIGEAVDVPSYLVENKQSLKLTWFENAKSVGISAGASAPEVLVDELIQSLKVEFDLSLEVLGDQKEKVFFPLPDRLNS